MAKLYPYQEDYLDGLPKNVIMAADTGLGKGQMALAHYRKYSTHPMHPLLIIAPASKVRTGDWDREVEMAFGGLPVPYQVVSYDTFARKALNYYPPPGAKLAIIMDECHYIANSQAKRSKAVVRLLKTHTHQFIGLSATPMPNGWSSAENYAIMFGLVKNKTEFIRTYVNIDRTKGFPIILGYNHIPHLEQFWGAVSRPLERTGIADLPESQKLERAVFLHPKVIDVYNKIRRTHMTEKGEMLDNPSKMFAYLRRWTTPHREDELISLLEGTNEHVIVFYNYDDERELIHKVMAKHFKDRDVYEQSGHVSNLPHRNHWKTMPPSVTIAQYQSASTAIELTYASVTIYLSPTYSFAQFHQSMGRTKRNGQEKNTLFYMISVQNTLDPAVYKVLKRKQDFSRKLLDIWLDSPPEQE